MDFSKFQRPNTQNSKEDMNVSKIETENQFWLFLEDSKNYFNGIHLGIDEDTTDQEAIDFCKKYKFLNFNELLEKDNKTITGKMLNNEHVKNLIKRFNDLVSRIKVFENKKELMQIIEEFNEFFGRFNLELDK
jgi:hypothetical protein